MRWIKHMSNTRADEKIAKILAVHGPEGYGLFWMVVETIASSDGGGGMCEATYPIDYLRKNFSVSRKKLENFLIFCREIEIFSVVFEKNLENSVKIGSPKLLKYHNKWNASRREKNEVLKSSPARDAEVEVEEDIKKKNPHFVRIPKRKLTPPKKQPELFGDDLEKPVPKKVEKKAVDILTDGWQFDERDEKFALDNGLSGEVAKLEAEAFRYHWMASNAPDRDRLKRDWNAAWRTWVLNKVKWAKEKNMGNQNVNRNFDNRRLEEPRKCPETSAEKFTRALFSVGGE